MQQVAERLQGKIQTLSDAQLAEVERFVESLQSWQRDGELIRHAAILSEPAFAEVWSNPEDEAYDDL